MKKVLLPVVFLFGFVLSAQTQDAWVYFTDKQNVAAAIANPITILSQAAIDRKNLHGTPIDARDVPVNPAYLSQIKSSPGITVFAKSKWFNCVYVRGDLSNIEALANLSFVDNIDFADSSLNFPDEPKSPSEQFKKVDKQLEVQLDFDYGSSTNQVEMMNVDYLHEQGYTGEGILVAVLDAGFPTVESNPGFDRMRDNGNLMNGYDFVDREENEFAYNGNSHGTHVLSCITGFISGEYVGTAPDASVVLFRTEDVGSENPVEMAYWVEAAERADSLGAFVINTSLGYNTFDNPAYSFQTSDMDGATAFISKGATVAFEKGMLPVCSAGNEGNDSSWGIVTAPADSPGAFTIGAVDPEGNYAPFSSIGPTADGRTKPDVVAQGALAAILTTGGDVGFSNGTSFSSPIMAGAIASLWQADPSKTNFEIMQIVRQSASQYTNPDIFLGYGIPNFQNALKNLSWEEPRVSIFPNPVSEKLSIRFSGKNPHAKIEIYSLLGKKVEEFSTTESRTQLNLASLSTGVYLVKITSETGNSTHKILKN